MGCGTPAFCGVGAVGSGRRRGTHGGRALEKHAPWARGSAGSRSLRSQTSFTIAEVTRSQPSAWGGRVERPSGRTMPLFGYVASQLGRVVDDAAGDDPRGPSVNVIVHSSLTVPIVPFMSWSTTSGVGFPGRSRRRAGPVNVSAGMRPGRVAPPLGGKDGRELDHGAVRHRVRLEEHGVSVLGDVVGGDVGGVDVDLAAVDRVDGAVSFVGDGAEGAEGRGVGARARASRPGWRRRSACVVGLRRVLRCGRARRPGRGVRGSSRRGVLGVCRSRPLAQGGGRDAPCASGAEPDGLQVPLLDGAADGGGVAADEAGRSPGQHRPRPACARLGRCQHITQHAQSYTSVRPYKNR